MIGPSITEKQLFTTLRGFLADILPPATQIVRAQVNRTAMPVGDFVLMTALRRERLSTNIDLTIDTSLTAQIDGSMLTVHAISNGSLAVGSLLFGSPPPTDWDGGTTDWDGGAATWDYFSYVLPGTRVTAFLTGTGGAGTYTVDPPQAVGVGPIYAGITRSVMPTEVTFQLDVFGEACAENAQIVSTVVRDEYATRWFGETGLDIQPLHADDGRQMPFIDAETQYENRWIVEVCLQANMEVDTPMQFADEVAVTIAPGIDAFCDGALFNPDSPPVPMIDANGNIILVPCMVRIA